MIFAGAALQMRTVLLKNVVMFQYLGLSKLSLQELQGLSVSLLTVLQGGQLLLHLPLQHNKTPNNRSVISYWKSI